MCYTVGTLLGLLGVLAWGLWGFQQKIFQKYSKYMWQFLLLLSLAQLSPRTRYRQFYNSEWKRIGYWSSFSFWVMFSTLSCSLRMPRAQCWASSWLWQRRSRLFLGPLKTTVKHRPSGTEPTICRNVSDWQPSRTHSTSMTETAERERTKLEEEEQHTS